MHAQETEDLAVLIAEEALLIQQRRRARGSGPVRWRPRRTKVAAPPGHTIALEGLDDAGQPVTAEPGGPGLRADSPGVRGLLERLEAFSVLRHPNVERVLGWGYCDGGDGSAGDGDGELALWAEPYVCGSAADLFARLSAPECRGAQQINARRWRLSRVVAATWHRLACAQVRATAA